MLGVGETVFIIQRVIPHYRAALFAALYERTGARVFTAERPPGGTFLNLADPGEHPWAIPIPVEFPDPKNVFAARIPLDHILETYRPTALVAEFGLRLSTTRELPKARRGGRLGAFAFWSHGWQMERGFRGPTDAFVQHTRLQFLAKADALGAYTEEGAQWLRSRLKTVPVVALGNALDTKRMADAAARARRTRAGSPQLIAIGRLTEDKRLDTAIEIFRGVRKFYPSAALTIIGDGPERPKLEALAGDDLGSSIVFTGAQHSEEELAPHFMGGDLLVLPGAAGLSVNHALAYALPVAAFARSAKGPRHHPEIEYVVEGHSGLIVEEPTPRAMVERIVSALGCGELQRLKSKLAETSPAPSINQVAANFETLFSLLEKCARGCES